MTTQALHTWSGAKLTASVRQGDITVSEVAEACWARITEREPVRHAFAHVDADILRGRAAELDRREPRGSLVGLPVAVKDLIDTVDYPTELGSPIFAGHRPVRDATVVDRLAQAGALMLGKTVTTEFALFQPGPTTNPWDRTRTPGGSSSGSAAATADHMVAAAVGTQTAGSVIRPAAFCGVVGFKPTFGAIDRTGLNVVSPSLDTLGVFARNVTDVALVFQAVRSHPFVPTGNRRTGSRRRLGVVRTAHWDDADPETRRAFDAKVADLAATGFDIAETRLPEDFEELTAAQITVMEKEVAETLTPQLERHGHLLSRSTRALIERGTRQRPGEYARAQDLAAACRSRLPDLFAGLDAVITLAVKGEAPPIESTGDPLYCRAWTLLHTPTVSLPLLTGPSGLPVGVQLVGSPGEDDDLLDVARQVMGENMASTVGSRHVPQAD